MIREMQERSTYLIQYVEALDDTEREFFVKNVCFIQKDKAYRDAQDIISTYIHQATFMKLWKDNSERFEHYKKAVME
jgi:hypothetical protein